jgi:PKD domain-containing protein
MKRTLILQAALLAAAALAIALPGAAVAAPPSNDDFANATVIDPSSLPFSDTVNTSEATTEASEPQYCYFLSQTDWYAITPSAAGVLRFDSSGSDSFDSDVNVYRQDGSGFGGLNFMGCGSFSNPVTLDVEAGKTYYVQAGKIYGGGGNVRVNVQLLAPPSNDDFANAKAVGSLPYSDSVDATAATIETGEPIPCYGPLLGSVWYAFTPSVSDYYSASSNAYSFTTQTSVYTGSGLNSLSPIGCRAYGQLVTFHADAGTTYYMQAGGGGGSGPMSFNLSVAPNPVAGFGFNPGDPSTFDTVQFYDSSYDPGGNGLSSEIWNFGDGGTASNPGCCPTHHYLADGDYAVKLSVTTTDGRTASITQTIHVRTHDVAIAKLSVPQSASAGQTRSIVVGISNKRYPETVQVQLFKSDPSSYNGYALVGTLQQSVPVRSGGRTTDFSFSYTFTSADKSLGKVTFKAVATIVGARDALPADNEAVALPTKVS